MNIDNPKHTFVIAEAGSNWKIGSLNDDINHILIGDGILDYE